MLVGLGRLVANKFFGFSRGTNLSSYTQLYVAFFLSAILHFSADFVCGKRVASRSFKFFLLQPVVITLEDLIIYIGKRLVRRGETKLKLGKTDESRAEVVMRVTGYIWVTLWLCLTLPAWLDELSAIGVGCVDRRPIAQFLLNRWNQGA